MKNCYLRLRKHDWSKEYYWRNHMYKRCQTCQGMRRTAHVSCSKECIMGPG